MALTGVQHIKIGPKLAWHHVTSVDCEIAALMVAPVKKGGVRCVS